jgi:pyridoxamine 5'-phosphate oxidase-like protein
MASWAEFEGASFELASFGHRRLDDRVAYLATLRADGSPRVHPVTVRIRQGRLFVRMDRTSPKVKDLLRDPRYSLHSLVTDSSGMGGEFAVSGRARLIEDVAEREWLEKGLPDPGRFVAFELSVEDALSTVYGGDRAVRHRWRATP